ncbi:hypothetical protein IHE45_09G043300 [Dioscorea alata]|uniref:Uncharacterized protein n=1 Tax=Dioscorea alata TaxID=55571 RepID=A0ACB7VEQ1_DIOAL|nr:hypothetical protein IHE45_09G043300 [Dioscorea alata]
MKRAHKSKPGGGRVHPSPTYPSMAALPTAILALVAVLSPEEQEVLAYLISGDKGKRRAPPRQHEPELSCDCFGCYKSFWARWDASPNRHLIHRILDAFEEKLEDEGKKGFQVRKGRRSRRRSGKGVPVSDDLEAVEKEIKGFDSLDGHVDGADDDHRRRGGDDSAGSGNAGENKSSVVRLVTFIGEKVWAVWS